MTYVNSFVKNKTFQIIIAFIKKTILFVYWMPHLGWSEMSSSNEEVIIHFPDIKITNPKRFRLLSASDLSIHKIKYRKQQIYGKL